MWCPDRCDRFGRAVCTPTFDHCFRLPKLKEIRDWIATIPSWPESFAHMPMKETALKLSEELRDPNGEHKVDIIVALTHCRVTNVSE